MPRFRAQPGRDAAAGPEDPGGRRPAKPVRSGSALAALAAAALAASPAAADTLSRSVDVDGTPAAV